MNTRFGSKDYKILTSRPNELYRTPGDRRDDFFRDYNRILHSNAYRRLKHKTQVFFNINNDHICTRMEHVNHVDAVSHSIAVELGLNTELTRAIAIGHDIGHAPFGHYGEQILNDLLKNYLEKDYKTTYFSDTDQHLFWHEKNGLRFADDIELIPDPSGIERNLNLTYAVRDGIISHCGEIDQNGLRPREDYIDLNEYQSPGQYQPYTWEGCVVKISDKIAYLGRDIEDAITLGFLSDEEIAELKKLAIEHIGKETLNTSRIMHSLIGDIIENSSDDKGICLGDDKYQLMTAVKNYNYKHIYRSEQFKVYTDYAKLVLESIFDILYKAYDKSQTIQSLNNRYQDIYPKLTQDFTDWLGKYCTKSMIEQNDKRSVAKYELIENEKIYGELRDINIYVRAIIDFISGMTDAYAIRLFNELITFS